MKLFNKSSIKAVVVLLCIAIASGTLLAVCNSLFFVSDAEREARGLKAVYDGSGTPVVVELKTDFAKNAKFGETISVFQVASEKIYIVKSQGNKGWASMSSSLININIETGIINKVVAIIDTKAEDKATSISQKYLDELYIGKNVNEMTYFSADASGKTPVLDGDISANTGATAKASVYSVTCSVNMSINYLRNAGVLANEEGDVKKALETLTGKTLTTQAKPAGVSESVKYYFADGATDFGAAISLGTDKFALVALKNINSVWTVASAEYYPDKSQDATFTAKFTNVNKAAIEAIAVSGDEQTKFKMEVADLFNKASRDPRDVYVDAINKELAGSYTIINDDTMAKEIKVAVSATDATNGKFFAFYVTGQFGETSDFELIIFVKEDGTIFNAKIAKDGATEDVYEYPVENLKNYNVKITSATMFDGFNGGLVTGATPEGTESSLAVREAFSTTAKYFFNKLKTN